MRYVLYAHLEYLTEIIDECENSPEKSSTTKPGEHIPCGYQISAIWGFDNKEDKHTLFCEKDCMEKLCESLREHAKSIIESKRIKIL